MQMMFKYLLFDLDGTLTNPFEGITKSVRYALKKCGVFENDLNQFKRFIGPPLIDSFRDFYGFSDEKANYAVEMYRERFAVKGWMENEIIDGIPQLLEELKNVGYIIVLATSKPDVYSEKILEYFDIKKYFDLTVSASLDGSISSKDEVINEAVRRIGDCDKETVLMIGDRVQDISGAKKCGVKSMGVRWGFAESGELESAGADYICDDINSLKSFLIIGE